MADSIPCRDRVAALHPAKNPGYGAQVFEAAALGAARRARTDARGVEFVHRCRLLEILEHIRVFGDVAPVDPERLLRHLFDRLFPCRRRGLFSRARECFEAGCNHQFQIPLGEDGISIFPIHYLALLGDTNLSGETSWRLRKNCGMSRTTAATDSTSTAVEQSKLDVE